MLKALKAAALCAGLPLITLDPGLAATATGNMNVRITIQAECKIVTATDLDFGTKGVIDVNVDQTSTISVQCTNGTPYTVGLSAGGGAGATVAMRKMTGAASATINYTIYRDAARTQVWGVTAGTDVVSGTGNGNAQSITAYGRVPAQTTPAPGVYSDVVSVTVTY
ncbi:Csu type fimbrial protein [Brucella anthropi]|uniref:Spore coat U domain protein n=1 Tax=Brucella anthropi (strain ATCC 49188 / DSM 6882 / CCUG 24695 / JCM 21032 / LMG 3331 / NBRC 15819 / NCTC 12168 / Alc 37) TaxID=439375 RepID=A6X8A6_BRUA4|nr:spore coat U domain-containing protein [Brucella anthropi]ABS17460.1 Spore coat U domain protein [Brucella anthropi ATCC 49188]AIK41111.1 spore Coat Protein U domain protein [Brucella anthropi]KAB2723336.1 spore coat U domain-containing protein [Brucella anthropi]KAB2744793.1 spore coat U domain-containing protein [Brucella anthropi]KAB2774851.1 spore coat U domain-containing protein [Brucella anthropi]